MPSRRAYLNCSLVCGSVMIAGCLSPSSTDGTTPDDEYETPNPHVSMKTPQPEVREVHAPETDNEPYATTIENESHSGEIMVRLYWVKEETDEPPDDEYLESAASKATHIDENETLEVDFEKESPDHVSGYWADAAPTTIATELENTGAPGAVEVALYADQYRIESQSVEVGSGEEKSITFDVDEDIDRIFDAEDLTVATDVE